MSFPKDKVWSSFACIKNNDIAYTIECDKATYELNISLGEMLIPAPLGASPDTHEYRDGKIVEKS